MNTIKEIGEAIKKLLPEAEFKENEKSASVCADLDVGIKGVSIQIDYSDTIVKVNGTREYTYPINEKEVERFQDDILEKYGDYTIYVTGQILNINKFFAYQDREEAVKSIAAALDAIKDAVLMFEDKCVDFHEENTEKTEEKEYDPEENIDIVDVDNSFHAVPTTSQDNLAYMEEHKTFARKALGMLAQELGLKGNIVACNDICKISKTGTTTRCSLSEDGQEIQISVSIKVAEDVGAMYASYLSANYAELMSSYDADNGLFIVRGYSYPDPYAPNEPLELMKLCQSAIDACVKEYKQTLTKKDSTDFASDVQQILSEQTAAIEEREKEISEKEEELKAAFAKVQEKERVLQQKAADFEKEKETLKTEIQAERDRIQEREREMKEEIQKYEERNTGDILKIQKLANQVASLQNRQKTFGTDNSRDEEIFRLKSKVQQLTAQKIALEKQLTDKLNAKEAHLHQLSDTIREKEAEIQKVQDTIDDRVKSRVAEEAKKTSDRIAELEEQVAEIGQPLAPDDLFDYLSRNTELQVKKLHSTTARFVAYQDGQLEIRVRFGEMNYIDVSCKATLKDVMLRKLNSKATGIGAADIKFYSTNRDNKIVARTYFKQTATVEEVDQLIEEVCSYFNK